MADGESARATRECGAWQILPANKAQPNAAGDSTSAGARSSRSIARCQCLSVGLRSLRIYHAALRGTFQSMLAFGGWLQNRKRKRPDHVTLRQIMIRSLPLRFCNE